MLLLVVSLPVYATEERQKEAVLPGDNTLPSGDISYHTYEDSEIMKIAELLYQSHRHTGAVEACEEALSRNLTSAQLASMQYLLAKTYEAIPNHGQEAKDTYSKIIQKYPDYDRLPEVAYRLGELNLCIIPEGTEPDNDKAIECLNLVITRLPIELNTEKDITYLSLKAHMMLGNLYLDKRENLKAESCFKKIYESDVTKSAPVPFRKFDNDNEKQEYVVWLKNRITNMKKRLPVKMVSACLSDDLAISMQKLNELQVRYPQDLEIRNIAVKMFRRLNQIKDLIDQELEDLNK